MPHPSQEITTLPRTVSLVSKEILALLQQAKEAALLDEETDDITSSSDVLPTSNNNAATFFSPLSSSEDDGNSGDDDDSSSSTDSRSQRSTNDEEEIEKAENKSPKPKNETTSTVKSTTLPRTPRYLHQLRHHSDQLMRLSFPLRAVESTNTTKQQLQQQQLLLQIPSVILDRQILQSSKRSQQLERISSLCLQWCQETKPAIMLVFLLRSGRFVGAVFQGTRCIDHKSFQRYTVRKGQGKAQSTQDGNRRPKSMGSQLRRAGEQALKEDIHNLLLEWKKQGHIEKASLIFVSAPKTMSSTLFGEKDHPLLPKTDPRIRKVPMDVGRPTLEGACLVYESVVHARVVVASMVTTSSSNEERLLEEQRAAIVNQESDTLPTLKEEAKDNTIQNLSIPLSDIHVAAKQADLSSLAEIFQQDETAVDQPAGVDFMTPLHFAAISTTTADQSNDGNNDNGIASAQDAAACVKMLLLEGHANPCLLDARGRPPYFLATHDKVRDAFRMARATLGEDAWDWSSTAKVGPALTEDVVSAKKEREAEKKRRKKARQKEKKAKDKADQAAKAEKEAAAAKESGGTNPSNSGGSGTGGIACDCCQKVTRGRESKNMFSRLEYKYCSSKCVQQHKRDLMAKAAMKRFEN